MRKFRLWFVFLAVLLVAAPLMGGVSLAEDTYTVQYITSVTGGTTNYLSFLQGISGFSVSSFGDTALVNVGFNNVDIGGVYNRNIGIGSFRNQGSVTFLNIEPSLEVSPVTFIGQMFSQGNQVTAGDFNYAVNLNFNGFRGSGIVVLNVMAGSFCNQFTSLTFNMGKNAIPSTPLSSVLSVMQGNPTVVSLSNQQMQAVAATADNDFKIQGKQSAVASIEGNPNIQGISAITLSAGVNNQVMHNVGVNIDTK
jgi:uncharacterized Zn-binding protein involved in type VI secretion